MNEESVLVLAPLGRDTDVVRLMLAQAGIYSEGFTDWGAVGERGAHEIGAILVTEEALTDQVRQGLLQMLEQQPVWSDLPILLLLSATGNVARRPVVAQQILSQRNVTILRRPVPTVTLLSVVKAALQGRRRQYEVRALLESRELQARKLEEQVWQRTRQIRALASQLTLAEHEERHRISQILHDDLQQQLYGLRIQLWFLRDVPNQMALTHQVGELEKLVIGAIETTRQLSADLSPAILRGEGLAAGIQWISQRMVEQYGITVKLDADDISLLLDDGRRVVLFQMVRELLFNTVKHAGVPEVTVQLRHQSDQLLIRVIDEGAGFNPEQVFGSDALRAGQGLRNVRERLELIGGWLEIQSAPNQGTRVTIVLPLGA